MEIRWKWRDVYKSKQYTKKPFGGYIERWAFFLLKYKSGAQMD